MAWYRKREPQQDENVSDDMFDRTKPATNQPYPENEDTSNVSQQAATSSSAGDEPSSSTDDDGGTLVIMQTSTDYVLSPTASSYTGTQSLLTATETTPAANLSTPSTSSAYQSHAITSATSKPSGVSNNTEAITANAHHHDGLSHGELAAAIVLPTLAVLSLFLIAFLLHRRRAQKSRGRGGSGVAFLPGIREKWDSLRSSNASSHQTVMEAARGAQPVVTNSQNNAYYTGLDTPSQGSESGRGGRSAEYAPGRMSEGGTTFEVPPPVYHARPHNGPTLPPIDTGLADLSYFPTPPTSAHPTAPTPGTVSSARALLALPSDPPLPSNRSAVSITSTLYSDTASVHSARAARMSIGGPQIVQPVLNQSKSGSLGDPFGNENEANTPLSTIPSREPVSPLEEHGRDSRR